MHACMRLSAWTIIAFWQPTASESASITSLAQFHMRPTLQTSMHASLKAHTLAYALPSLRLKRGVAHVGFPVPVPLLSPALLPVKVVLADPGVVGCSPGPA